MPGEPLFSARLPFLDFLQREHEAKREAVTNAISRAVDHYHQVMVLAAGIAGVVVPLLFSQARVPVDSRLLQWAVGAMCITIVVGALSNLVARWFALWGTLRIERLFQETTVAVSQAEDDEQSIARAMAEVAIRYPNMPWLVRLMIGLNALGDLLLYGAFVAGTLLLMAALTSSLGGPK